MDHRYIEESNLVDYYVLGKLPPDEQDRFEEHFVDCQECLERIETTKAFQRGLKRAAAEDVALWHMHLQGGVLLWLRRRNRFQKTLIFSTLILLVTLPLAIFFARLRQANFDLEQSRANAVDLQRRYEEQQRVISELEKNLQQAQTKPNERQALPEADPNKNSLTEQIPENNQKGIAVFALNIVRSLDGAPTTRISFPPTIKSVVLSVDLEGATTDFVSYQVTISSDNNRTVWKRDNYRQRDEVIKVQLDSALLKPGNYQLTVEGLAKDNRYLPAGTYTFRVIDSDQK